MSQFTKLADWYEPIPKTRTGFLARFERPRYTTTQEVAWENGSKGSGHWVRVPVGYEFDVSIPMFAWPLFSPANPKYHKAACLHDYCLEVHKWGRVYSAASFSDALKATKVGKWDRLAMVLSVIVWKWR